MQLLDSEELLAELRPHWVLWVSEVWHGLLIVCIGLALWLCQPTVDRFLPDIVSPLQAVLPQSGMFILVLALVSLLRSLLSIRFRLFLGHGLALGAILFFQYQCPEIPHLADRALVIFGLSLVLINTIATTQVVYWVTDQRIVIQSGMMGGSERTFFYKNILDLVLKCSFWGRFFGYGTIVPLTATQLGMGTDGSEGQIRAGGKLSLAAGFSQTRNSIKADQEFCLYCIPAPKTIHRIILEQMAAVR